VPLPEVREVEGFPPCEDSGTKWSTRRTREPWNAAVEESSKRTGKRGWLGGLGGKKGKNRYSRRTRNRPDQSTERPSLWRFCLERSGRPTL